MKVRIWDVMTRRVKWVEPHNGIATCGACGRSWDDTIPTWATPAPSGRCPFEGMRRAPKIIANAEGKESK